MLLRLCSAGQQGHQAAAWAVDLIGVWASATAAEQTLRDERGARGLVEAHYLDPINEYYDTLDPAVYPSTLALRHQLLTGSGEDRAAWGLNVLLNGIVATPANQDPAASASAMSPR